MYEHFRTELISEIATHFDSNDISLIISALDKISYNYDFNEKETALALREDVIPKQVKLYLATLTVEGKSKNTIDLYGGRLKIFFETVRKPLDQIEGNDIRLFLAEFKNRRKVNDETLEAVRTILSVFFKWCVCEEYLTKNPALNVKKIKFQAHHRQALTRFQLEQLRRACKTKRERAIVEVLYSTGVRVAELCNMKRSEIDPVNKCITVLGKGKKLNTVYFNESSQYALDEYDDSRIDNSDWLFYSEKTKNHVSINTVELMFRELSERCGFYVCPHIMRHTFATLSLQAGMPINIVQKSLAHSSVATTQRYAKTMQEDVQNAHKKYVV